MFTKRGAWERKWTPRALRVQVFASLNCLKIITPFRCCYFNCPLSKNDFWHHSHPKVLFGVASLYSSRADARETASLKRMARKIHAAPSLRANAISKKFVFILYPSLFSVQKTMHCFSFSQRASAKIFAHPRWLFYKFSPAVIERYIKVASPRAATSRDIPAAALYKKVLHFNHFPFPIVQFKRSIFLDFF